MEYTKLQLKWTRSDTFKSAEPAARGVWVGLIAYCADQENGGRIIACQTWTDRRWMAAAAATREEIEQAVVQGLATWNGADLVVGGYDIIGEQTFQAVSAANQDRANLKWEKERAKKGGQPPKDTVPCETVPPAMRPASKHPAAGNAPGIPPAMRPASIPDAGGNAHPVQSIQTNQSKQQQTRTGAGEREPAAAAGPDLDEETDTPELLATVLALAVSLGGRDEFDGKPLAAEWSDAFKGLTPVQVYAIWRGHPDPIALPSTFKAARKAWRESQVREEQNAAAEQARQRQAATAAAEAKEREIANAKALANANVRAEGIRRMLAAIEQDPALLDVLPEGEQQRLAIVKALLAKGDTPRACLLVTTMRDHLPAELRRMLDAPAAEGAVR